MRKCTDCLADIPIPKDAMAGEVITCPDCGSSFEVVSTSPWSIRKAESQGEDWGQ